MLKCTRVEILRCVLGSVVISQSRTEGEIEARHSGLLEDRQIGVIGHGAVNIHAQRGSQRLRYGLSVLANQPAVVFTRLKHDRRTGIAPRIEIEHEADLLGPRMLVNK